MLKVEVISLEASATPYLSPREEEEVLVEENRRKAPSKQDHLTEQNKKNAGYRPNVGAMAHIKHTKTN